MVDHEKPKDDDTTSVRVSTPSFPTTFWGVIGALVCWPFLIVAMVAGLTAALGFTALVIVGALVAACAFVVLGIPVAWVFWVVGKILD